MSRYLKFEVGGIYHIFNRGVEKRDIFLDDTDRWRFLQALFLFNNKTTSHRLLWDLAVRKKRLNFKTLRASLEEIVPVRTPLVRIIADCFMPNHYHLVLEELQERGISNFMHKLGMGFAKYFNERYARVGGLFQGPFRAVRVENDDQMKYLLAYLHVVNPGQLVEPDLKNRGVLNAKAILKFAEEYPWSTHKEYLGLRESVVAEKGIAGLLFPSSQEYKEFVESVIEGKQYEQYDSSLYLDK
ncbi:MAG: transposase [Candidatus Wildermuthbacteria bacterium]|nr:transposase [Candidatus Wildermuthbacteria bacterium]